MIKNKKGWIRIVEAFVAVLLIMGVLLIVLNQGYIGKKDMSAEIYKVEISILREVQLNNDLRNDILNIENPPIEWENFGAEGLSDLKNKIISRLPNYLDCEAKICAINETCGLDKIFNEDIYAQSVSITAGLTEFNPRQLKLFCWIGTPSEVEELNLCGNSICEEGETNANCPLDCYCGDGVCWNDETWETCPEDCEEPSQTCEEAGGTCKTNSCISYSDCSVLSGTCASGYCCSGTCTVPTCTESGGTICTGEQTCPGTLLDASDSDRCCSEECEEPRAILTLMFSNTDYELKFNVNIDGTVYPEVYYYYHTRTFTESNGVGVTLTSGQLCYSDGSCSSVATINYRINENSVLIRENEYFLTTLDSEIFTLKYWGTDDNGYDVAVEQKMCVQKSQFTENC